MKARLQVDLIEDDAAVRESLSLYLGSKGMHVRAFENADSFLGQGGPNEDTDCIVIDVRMPGMSGVELQKALARKAVTTQLVMITAYADIDAAVEAMKAGAFDFLEKPVDEPRLVASIRKAASRSETLHAEAAEVADMRQRLEMLTDREREVMLLATRGLTNRQIAAELGISPRTVEVYRASVMLKARADSLADLVRMTLRLGLHENVQKDQQRRGRGRS
jgi:two-component system response regulator FixJ